MSTDVLLVVPTRGERPAYLREALHTVTSQTGVGVHVVVVANDLSAGLREACDADGVSLVRQSSSGISAAINEGWRAEGASVPYWTWLGDDDLLAPLSLSRTVAELSGHADASMVYGDCAYIDDQGRTRFLVRPTRWAGAIAAHGPNFIPQPGSLLRADAVRAVGLLDESLRYAMDLDLFLRLAGVGGVRYTDQVLGAFRWHSDSTTVANQSASSQEARAVRASAEPQWPALNREWGVLASVVGRLMKRRGSDVDPRTWTTSSLPDGRR